MSRHGRRRPHGTQPPSNKLACDAQIKHEFFLSQVEVATGAHVRLGAIREELTAYLSQANLPGK